MIHYVLTAVLRHFLIFYKMCDSVNSVHFSYFCQKLGFKNNNFFVKGTMPVDVYFVIMVCQKYFVWNVFFVYITITPNFS